jgi:hypothetical protein
MADMQRAYKVAGKRSYRVMIDDKPGKTAYYHIWRFKPLTPESHLSQTVSNKPYKFREAYLPEDLQARASR